MEVQNKHSEKIEYIQTSCGETCMKQHAVWSHTAAVCSASRVQVTWGSNQVTRRDKLQACLCGTVGLAAASCLSHPRNIDLSFSICKTHHIKWYRTMQPPSAPICDGACWAERKIRCDSCPSCNLAPRPSAKEGDSFINSNRTESLSNAWL